MYRRRFFAGNPPTTSLSSSSPSPCRQRKRLFSIGRSTITQSFRRQNIPVGAMWIAAGVAFLAAIEGTTSSSSSSSTTTKSTTETETKSDSEIPFGMSGELQHSHFDTFNQIRFPFSLLEPSSSSVAATTTKCLWNPFRSSNESQEDSQTEQQQQQQSPKRRLSSGPKKALQHFKTSNLVAGAANKEGMVNDMYKFDEQVLGEGTYGTVHLATLQPKYAKKESNSKNSKSNSNSNNTKFALKKIPKQSTNSVSFQQEMRAMMYIRAKGGHPHVCALHEHFDEPLNYYVIMEAVMGGEVFDNLIEHGAYNEVDASRFVRDVASALNFLHGIGVCHADLKPENLLLTTTHRGDAMVKMVDFGCSQLLPHADEDFVRLNDYEPVYAAPTPAYCPKESIDKTTPIQPSADMWALGVILFILLTGAHPFDLTGEATDEEIEKRIQNTRHRIPIDSKNVTGHLSASAKDLLRKLLDRNPERRLTALQVLQHPWVRGETVRQTSSSSSNDQQEKRLATIRRFRTKLEAKFFESAILGSDDDATMRRKKSLIFHGYEAAKSEGGESSSSMDMSDFSTLLGDSIQHKHFPTGHTIYQQGDTGHHMYFIESGSIQVVTKDGSVGERHQGDFFGEGALLNSHGLRSTTIKCKTPVHALEISRDYFNKYVKESGKEVLLTLKEKDKIRRRNHMRTILSLQESVQPIEIPYKKAFFKDGDTDCDSLFVLEKGRIDVTIGKNIVFIAYPGNILGEHSVLTNLPRNCNAICSSKGGCSAKELSGKDFRTLAEESPQVRSALKDLQLRREFKKAVVRRLKKQFPYQKPQEAFQAADQKQNGYLDQESVAELMRELHPGYSDEEIQEILETLSLTSSGRVTFEEFEKVFIGDRRTSDSM